MYGYVACFGPNAWVKATGSHGPCTNVPKMTPRPQWQWLPIHETMDKFLAELVLVDVAVDPILYERQCCIDDFLLSLVGFVAEVLTFIDLLMLDL